MQALSAAPTNILQGSIQSVDQRDQPIVSARVGDNDEAVGPFVGD